MNIYVLIKESEVSDGLLLAADLDKETIIKEKQSEYLKGYNLRIAEIEVTNKKMSIKDVD